MPALEDLQTALGYRFRDAALLSLSLTHPSVVHEEGGEQNHNQRLEFLGDAVIQLAITSELYQRFPGLGEGALTQARAQLVNRTSLAAQARRLQLGQHLILSRGEDSSGGRARSSTLADAFEAIIGAVYVDGGFETARHDRTFRCAVLHGGVELARGVGRSKKAAESHAALLALQKLKSAAAPPVPEP